VANRAAALTLETRWRPRSLANAAWGSAKLLSFAGGAPPPELRRALRSCLEKVARNALGELEYFNGQELANLAWAMAAGDCRDAEVFERIAEKAPSASFRPQELSNIIWSFGKLVQMDDGGGSEGARRAALRPLTREAGKRFSEFKPQELANIVWAVATCGFDAGTDFWDLAATEMISNFEADVRTAKSADFDFARDVAGRSVRATGNRRGRGKGQQQHSRYVTQTQNLGNFLWAAAKTKACSPETTRRLFEVAGALAFKRMAELNNQELGNVAWAFATVGVHCEGLFERIASVATPKLASFNTQNVANVLWAFATARPRGGGDDFPFFRAAAREAAKKAKDFKPQELANCLWAFAAAGVRAPPKEFLDAFAIEASAKVHLFTEQGLSNVAWSYSNFDAPPYLDLFENIEKEVVRRGARELTPQAMANLPWSFANAELRADDLFDAIGRDIATGGAAIAGNRQRPSSSSSSSLDDDVKDKDDEKDDDQNEDERRPRRGGHFLEVALHFTEFVPQEFTNVAWAFARNGATYPGLYDAMAQAVLAHAARREDPVGNWTRQELANLAWTYACADHVDPALLALLWAAIVDKAKTTRRSWTPPPGEGGAFGGGDNVEEWALPKWGFELTEMRQLQQVVLHLRYEARGGRASNLADVSRAPPEFLGDLRRALADVRPLPSRAQKEVAQIAVELGFEVSPEFVTPEGLSVDVALLPASNRLGLEFDGPTHFFRNDPQRPTGRTRFKMRLLRATGWRVLHVPYYDWNDLDDFDAKRAYVRDGLRHLRRRQQSPAAKKLEEEDAPAVAIKAVCDDDDDSPKDDLEARDAYSTLKVAELRHLCDLRGLDRTVKRSAGKKARSVLEARLRDHDASVVER